MLRIDILRYYFIKLFPFQYGFEFCLLLNLLILDLAILILSLIDGLLYYPEIVDTFFQLF